ncbi:MAG: outer membrane beta-barrel protein [Bacteroidetes bacterium]|nr:outer membrane beta-barrel protein [Bacteroidota bacterium]
MVIKTILFLVSIIVSTSLFAQYDSQGKNQSRFKPGLGWTYKGIRPPDTNHVNRYDRWMIDLGYCTWMGDRTAFSNAPASIGFGLNFMFDRPITKGSRLSLGYGVQYKRTQIQHNEGVNKNFNPNFVQLDPVFFGERSSFHFNQISVPLELRIRQASWRHFKLHLGGSLGYAYSPLFKTVLVNPNGKIIIKDKQVPDFNPFQYGVHARFGIRNYAFIGGYSFSKLFKSNESSQLNTLFIGLTISLF